MPKVMQSEHSLIMENLIKNNQFYNNSSTDVIIEELENYSNIRANVNEFSCPLNFYKINENIIPNMAKIAKMVFCITASSVPSECLFSTAGDLISQKRSRLHPECAQDLLLLNKNKFE